MVAEMLFEIRGLRKYFPVYRGLVVSKVVANVKAIDGVDFHINTGESFGLVGESGCGKTTTAKILIRLEMPTAGDVLFKGKHVDGMRGGDLALYRSLVQPVMQDPFSSLDPRMRVGDIISEPLAVRGTVNGQALKDRVASVLSDVGLPSRSASLYPHEFSGGQRQRIAIARALISKPQCIILDEPVSALDVSIRAQIMNLLDALRERMGLTYIIIAHDLGVVKHMSTRIAVMYLGRIVEIAKSGEIFKRPLHPYTQALFSAALPAHPDTPRKQILLRGEVPSPLRPPAGCRFHPRCFRALPMCSESDPAMKKLGDDHEVACHLAN